jgi:hypothetical protein
MQFQVQYKYKSKTFTTNLEANSYRDVLDIFVSLSACEVTEIREFKYISATVIKDDGDYHGSMTAKLSNDKSFGSFKIPKVRKNLSVKTLTDLIINNITLNGLPVKKVVFSG